MKNQKDKINEINEKPEAEGKKYPKTVIFFPQFRNRNKITLEANDE